MSTIHTSIAGTFQCEHCQRFTFKICNKIHTKMEVCMMGINLEKIAELESGECCNADFWPVRRLVGFS